MQLGKQTGNIAIIGLSAAAVFLLAVAVFLAFGYISSQSMLARSQAEAISLNSTNAQLNARLVSIDAQNRELADSVNSLNSTLASAQKDLEITKFILNSTSARLDTVQAQLEANKSALSSQQESIAQINDSIYAMQAELNASFSWFQANSILPAGLSSSIDFFRLRVLQDCTELNPTSRMEELNLACAYDRMQHTAVSISYKPVLGNDHVQSLLETAQRWGGDCKAIALFSKATINYIKEEDPNATVAAWESGSGEFRVFPLAGKSNPGDTYYYYLNADKVYLGKLSQIYPYVVCYLDGAVGHCTVALSKVQVNSSSQMELLNGASVYEPSGGEFIGTIGQDFQVCSTTLAQCEQSNHYIWVVMADKDVYSFGQNGWGGFADFAAELGQVQNQTIPGG